MKSPYDVLGIDPDADDATVVDAYRERVKEVHPDQGGSAEAFQRVTEAYQRIRDGEIAEAEPKSRESGVAQRSGQRERTSTRSPSQPDRREGPVTVEYLDYEVLDDHGWSIDDEGLFKRAGDADLEPVEYGKFVVHSNETLLEAAENRGFAWPFACRGGACTNCAVAVVDGEMPPPTGHILPEEMIDRGIRLSCLAAPVTDDTQIVYNVKHMPEMEELLLPASRFEKAHSD